MQHVTFRGNLEEEDFQEVPRKRPRGRTPAFAVIQERAAKDLRQGKLTLAVRDSTVPTAAAAGATAAPVDVDPDIGMQGA
jgi:hypothetical protein